MEQLLRNEAFVDALVTLLTLIVTAVIVPVVRQWLQAKVGTEKYEQLSRFVTQLVESAQQQWADSPKDMGNTEKKLFVLSQAELFARSIGLKVEPLVINALVEAAVFNLKQWQPVKLVPVEEEKIAATM